MKYLVIDTSNTGTIVGIFNDKEPLLISRDKDSSKQNEVLPILVRDMMARLDIKFSDIGKILVTKGPGSFTGIRIGLSFARGLGLSNGIEVVGIDNFDALKGNVRVDNDILIAIDSKKGDWFLKTPKTEPQAGGIELAEFLIKDMFMPKLISFKADDLGVKLGLKVILETEVTATGIVNAYYALSTKSDRSPNPVYIRSADVTIKKCI
ncbi:MAG: tRNA threonylcarbamoyladenosine biosynthesis protein TsaB [Alphaproteobacteria bacterium ADurb.Bin438]|nr:MAG: tRNA threonylcarbamoyladenosine biosynthesis protein TsaB [Alphaproteobacteria bacterium ADurb.Bin438]